MEYLRVINIVKQHVGDAEQVRQLLLLDAVDRLRIELLVGRCVHLLRQQLQGAREEPARATCEIGDGFSQLRCEHLCHEVGYGARRVELARVAG